MRSRCFIKKSAFNVAGNFVIVDKIQDTLVREVAKGHSSCISILFSDWPTSKQKVYVTEIVLLLGFADVIFRRERSDDRKYVCASQANFFVHFFAVVLHDYNTKSFTEI